MRQGCLYYGMIVTICTLSWCYHHYVIIGLSQGSRLNLQYCLHIVSSQIVFIGIW